MTSEVNQSSASKSHVRDILRLAVPAMLAIASEPIFLLADTAMIGRLGVEPLAARAIASSLIGGIYWLFAFLIFGTTTLVAYERGASDRFACGAICLHAVFLACTAGLAVSILGMLLAPHLYSLMGAEPAVTAQGAAYLRIRIAGTPFTFLFFATVGFLRGVQDTRTPMAIAFTVNGLNLVLDYLLIYGILGLPAMGLRGAAVAVLISQVLGGIICLKILFFSPYASDYGLRRWRFDLKRLLSLSHIGRDLAIRTGALRFSLVFATGTVARMGSASLSAHEIALQLFLLSSDTIDGLAVAGQTLSAKYLGENRPETAISIGKQLIVCGCIVGFAFGLVYLVFRPQLIALFTTSPDVMAALGLPIFVMLALFQPINGIVFASDGFLIGAHDTRYLMRAMLIGAVGIFVPLCWISLRWELGLTGVWVGLSVLMAWRLTTNLARFFGGRWKLSFPTKLQEPSGP